MKNSTSSKESEVDRAGFEPAASALRRRRSYQTDLPAQEVSFGKEHALRDKELSESLLVEFGHLSRKVTAHMPRSLLNHSGDCYIDFLFVHLGFMPFSLNLITAVVQLDGLGANELRHRA